MTTLHTPNPELAAERERLLARVHELDAERDELIDIRFLLAHDKKLSRKLAAKIIRLGAECDTLENQAHEIYRRMFSNLVTVRQDGTIVPAEITMTVQDEDDERLVIGDPRGLQWTPEVFAAGENYDCTPCPPQPVINLDDVEEVEF